MTPRLLPALAASSLILTACGTPFLAPAPAPSPAAAAQRGGQLELALASGDYRCSDGLRIQVERETSEQVNKRIHIGWNGNRYSLARDRSYSGLPRFEDAANGLVWIDLPWKSLLLDARTQKPLADECRSI